ncbi:ABC transporter permease [Ructibacterium gallinarum]|uniref:Sugar ABC transporter permease n=1 Tax=Ructibacterium gallinarum TaxID=2779355 RepID=A0A9D5R7S2_9FIRM|nr:ABC transporter permease subunit [Ructibacterium gallinarum]MBE5039130.1 sugar ABC transporter permease [Ructibacterium gallinarum]
MELLASKKRQKGKALQSWRRDFRKNGSLYLLVLPVVIFYFIFNYMPMYGVLMSFQDFSPRLGIGGSEWVGLQHFRRFLGSTDFQRVFFNTLKISFSTLICEFPTPILLALMLNEMQNRHIKKVVQTLSYLPHFISLVVICGMIKTFVANDGLIGSVIAQMTGNNSSLLMQANKFLPIYVLSSIWQAVGWESIIYLAALAGVDPQLYEAAEIDGAGRIRKIINITLPSISTTIVTMLILRLGKVMNVGYEKIILLYNEVIYDTSDVISTYVYRMGFENQDWGYSAAVGLFNSAINLVLLVFTNTISKKMSGTSLW